MNRAQRDLPVSDVQVTLLINNGAVCMSEIYFTGALEWKC